MSGSRPGSVSSATGSAPAPAAEAWCDDEFLYVRTKDGRVVRTDLPDLVRGATPEQRRNCRVDEFGVDIYWPDLDEYLGVNSVFDVPEDVIFDLAGFETPED